MKFNLFVVGILLAGLAAAAEPTGRYKTIVDRLKDLQKKNDGITELFSIGDNDDSVPVYALRVSTSPKVMDTKKIGHVMVGTHHGNESGAPEMVMQFLSDLLDRYNSDELFKGKLGDIEWTIIPVLNVSGYNANNRYEHGVDPNRDYPGPCISGAGGKLGSIRLMMKTLATRPYTGSITVHGYVGAMTYPWGIDVGDTHTLDHNQFASITQKAAELNGYQAGTSTDIVYPCDGSYEDYAYWKHGAWSLLIELESGSASDNKATALAAAKYFDLLDSSPSTKNQLMSSCNRGHRPDLSRE